MTVQVHIAEQLRNMAANRKGLENDLKGLYDSVGIRKAEDFSYVSCMRSIKRMEEIEAEVRRINKLSELIVLENSDNVKALIDEQSKLTERCTSTNTLRHRIILKASIEVLAIDMKTNNPNMPQEELYDKLKQVNREHGKPLSIREVRSVARRAWEYKPPIAKGDDAQ